MKNPRPEWLTIRLNHADPLPVRACLRELNLTTVCAGARCPNRAECYGNGRATFMLMGEICTRRCRYCAVPTGEKKTPLPLDDDEPRRVAAAAARLKLRHLVITSVTRDDLPDGGAAHFARTVAAGREAVPAATIEILTPDFGGDEAAWRVAAASLPAVYNHNVETVARLFPLIRPQGDFARSVRQLAWVKKNSPRLTTKSGLMVGLGETAAEVLATARELRAAGVDLITVGQYLPPTDKHYPAQRYVTPDEFARLREDLVALGFAAVAAAPLVRSSYRAEETYATVRR
ncbi:MAG: lipoyl synthase [Planctomycetota bacterium]|jgi:lipoic acid synthetase|nr:lipoyl synthase [Planctomycetota bacterium]